MLAWENQREGEPHSATQSVLTQQKLSIQTDLTDKQLMQHFFLVCACVCFQYYFVIFVFNLNINKPHDWEILTILTDLKVQSQSIYPHWILHTAELGAHLSPVEQARHFTLLS